MGDGKSARDDFLAHAARVTYDSHRSRGRSGTPDVDAAGRQAAAVPWGSQKNYAGRDKRLMLRVRVDSSVEIVQLNRAEGERWRNVKVNAAAQAVAKALSLELSMATGKAPLVAQRMYERRNLCRKGEFGTDEIGLHMTGTGTFHRSIVDG